jgi:hypothetical protein
MAAERVIGQDGADGVTDNANLHRVWVREVIVAIALIRGPLARKL